MENKDDTVGHTSGNTKNRLRCRSWFLTWNNPDSDTVFTELLEISGVKNYIFQLEEGDSGTPHFQGVVYYENARSFDSMKKICKEIHWEPCHDWRAANKYCCKEKGRIAGPWSKGIKVTWKLNIIKELRPWQEELDKLTDKEPDNRTIVWYFDPVGNAGKTQMARYLVFHKKAFYCSGKSNDIKYGLVKWMEANPDCDIVIFDFCRSLEKYTNYEAIEAVKNGIFFSGKYESSMAVYNPPHVICFSNFFPDIEALSKDRWVIHHLSLDPHRDIAGI